MDPPSEHGQHEGGQSLLLQEDQALCHRSRQVLETRMEGCVQGRQASREDFAGISLFQAEDEHPKTCVRGRRSVEMLVLALISYGHIGAPSKPNPTPALEPLPMWKDPLRCNLEMPQPYHCAHHSSTLIHPSSPWGQHPVPGSSPFVTPEVAVPPLSVLSTGAPLLCSWECPAKNQTPEDIAQGYQEQKRENFQHAAKLCLTIE